jgi:hypothetical protein
MVVLVAYLLPSTTMTVGQLRAVLARVDKKYDDGKPWPEIVALVRGHLAVMVKL